MEPSISMDKELLTYMSQKLMNVAQLNTVLDQFGWKDKASLLPEASNPQIKFVRHEPLPLHSGGVRGQGYRFAYNALITNPNWIRVVQNSDFESPTPLETQSLSPSDLRELEMLELF